MKKITAVIPAGGKGGGMYPFTAGMPKSLIPIENKPMLVHILENLDPEVFNKIIIVGDTYFPMIQEYVGAFKHKTTIPIECIQVYEPPTRMLLQIKDKLSDTFAIHYCDIVTGKIAWKNAYERYLKTQEIDPDLAGNLFVSQYYYLPIGVVRQDLKKDGYISEFEEKPDRIMRNFVNMAVSIFSKKVLENIQPADESFYGESIPRCISKGKRFLYQEHGRWYHFQRLGEWFDKQSEFYKEYRK